MDQPANPGSNTLHVNSYDIVTKAPISSLTELPHEIFLLIISYLSPTDSVLCRRVSRLWNVAFTSDDASWNLMRWHFPRVREMRNTATAPDLTSWVDIFPQIARRYHHLRSATPRLVETIDTGADPEQDDGGPFAPVEPWHRWLQWNDNVAAFQSADPDWCMDDGLLVYRDSVADNYVVYDLETSLRFPIPFPCGDRIVRRLRLRDRTLVIEWCERTRYYPLGIDEIGVHRHFATAFDVQRSTKEPVFSQSPVLSWEIRFRSEWKLHHPGLTVSGQDRFFSAHTATHYALYLWLQSGIPWDEDNLVEQLVIWEIGGRDLLSPDQHTPPADPTTTEAEYASATRMRSRVIRRFTRHDLDFLGVRQGGRTMLRALHIDEANVYVHEETHRWLAGPHAPPSPPRHHHVRATGFPFVGVGPCWSDECCADGDIHLSFCLRVDSSASSSSSSWLGRAPCWRHEEFPYLTLSNVVDVRAGVRIAARQCFFMEALSLYMSPRLVSVDDDTLEDPREVTFADDLWGRLMRGGTIAGDERWVVGEGQGGKITIVRF